MASFHVKVAQLVPSWISSATCSGWLAGWSLTSLVSTNMAISQTNLFWNRTKEDKYNTFYGPDVLPVTQPTVSKHWRKHKSLTSANGLASLFTLIEGALLPLCSHRRQYQLCFQTCSKKSTTNFQSNSANVQTNKHADKHDLSANVWIIITVTTKQHVSQAARCIHSNTKDIKQVGCKHSSVKPLNAQQKAFLVTRTSDEQENVWLQWSSQYWPSWQ